MVRWKLHWLAFGGHEGVRVQRWASVSGARAICNSICGALCISFICYVFFGYLFRPFVIPTVMVVWNALTS